MENINYRKPDVIILGSTGSIGRQSINVCRRLGLKINGLACRSDIAELAVQVREFRPDCVAVTDERAAEQFAAMIEGDDFRPEIFAGADAAERLARLDCDKVIVAMVGFSAIRPVLAAIESGHDLALANKETLVATGQFIMAAAARKDVRIIPVDSEPSAIWQCLAGSAVPPEKLWLTASGGPFRHYPAERFAEIRVEDALNHPVWSMGRKITIDSATMMNKGLEMIEASCLFGIEPERIEIVVHPQSIVHSMVEFADGAVLAQLGCPDMELPIQLALTWPMRARMDDKPKLDFAALGKLEFEPADPVRFPALRLAYAAAREGGAMPAVMNAANEIAVDAFIAGRIGYADIAGVTEQTMDAFAARTAQTVRTIDDVLAADAWARTYSNEMVGQR